jgi:hypothetical protein
MKRHSNTKMFLAEAAFTVAPWRGLSSPAARINGDSPALAGRYAS